MAQFLTTNAISSQLESIIMEAKFNLVLLSPYWKISPIFAERLKNASKKGVVITVIFGKGDLKVDQLEILGKIRNLEIVYVENLHAKCYFNESKMIITSMNLHSFSERNNREMGVLIEKLNDLELFEKARDEALSIKSSGERGEIVVPPRQINRRNYGHRLDANMGFCLRCGEDVTQNINKPLCTECYDEWAGYKNPDYLENFCHSCGAQSETTIEKPLCYQCFSESKRKIG